MRQTYHSDRGFDNDWTESEGFLVSEQEMSYGNGITSHAAGSISKRNPAKNPIRNANNMKIRIVSLFSETNTCCDSYRDPKTTTDI